MLSAGLSVKRAASQESIDLNEIVLTTQNQYGTVSQLLIRDGVLYLLDEVCNLVLIRQLSECDIAAIRALSFLSADEVGLHLQLISYAPLNGADISNFCVASDPVSSFITNIRQEDADSINIAGMLAGGLGLLLGLGGAGGGGGGAIITPPDRTSFSFDDDTKNDVNIIYTGGSSDETVMILEDFLDGISLQDLTLADFNII